MLFFEELLLSVSLRLRPKSKELTFVQPERHWVMNSFHFRERHGRTWPLTGGIKLVYFQNQQLKKLEFKKDAAVRAIYSCFLDAKKIVASIEIEKVLHVNANTKLIPPARWNGAKSTCTGDRFLNSSSKCLVCCPESYGCLCAVVL